MTGTELFYYFVEYSSHGLAFEVGPLNFVLQPYDGTLPRLVYSPDSWTRKGYDIGDISSSRQVVTFLRKWFDEHPWLLSNPFYVAGDSYGGKMTPLVAQFISEGDFFWRRHNNCLSKAAVKNCKGDYVNPTNELCASVLQTINDEYRYYLSYFWVNDNATRAALGIRERTVTEWVTCKRSGFPYTHDVSSSIKYHFNQTTRGYRALVYSGDHDLGIPFLGTHAWIRSFNFSIVDAWRAWHLDGQAAGLSHLLMPLNFTIHPLLLSQNHHFAPSSLSMVCG
ncbi:hypothetical protein HU200_039764 [Digitaria exilis]|uniref:Serine carboxypeptidase n=1 Tax=Digitaria exilis TaxID=1010633 RepID=A0A835BBG7_9POAL|nr:hypothetical protein HU200_039764 [Digitaria exilis]